MLEDKQQRSCFSVHKMNIVSFKCPTFCFLLDYFRQFKKTFLVLESYKTIFEKCFWSLCFLGAKKDPLARHTLSTQSRFGQCMMQDLISTTATQQLATLLLAIQYCQSMGGNWALQNPHKSTLEHGCVFYLKQHYNMVKRSESLGLL